MSRSSWKGNFIDKSVLKLQHTKKSYLRIMSRSSVIPEFLIGKDVYIHNGNSFKSLSIDDDCVGYKFGEFSFTRKFVPKPYDKKFEHKKKRPNKDKKKTV